MPNSQLTTKTVYMAYCLRLWLESDLMFGGGVPFAVHCDNRKLPRLRIHTRHTVPYAGGCALLRAAGQGTQFTVAVVVCLH